jgi:hypothetical protein
MASFNDSHWSDSGFAQKYRNQADGYIPERRKLIEIAKLRARRQTLEFWKKASRINITLTTLWKKPGVSLRIKLSSPP